MITSADGGDHARGTPISPAGQLIDVARARTMLGTAIEFGAHKGTHPDLTEVESAPVLDEVLGSKTESRARARRARDRVPHIPTVK